MVLSEQTKVNLTVGIFVLLLAGGATYIANPGDTAYHCENTDLIGLCFKLSNTNADGFQTRCYYDEETPRKYKSCRSGWNEYTFTENSTGIPIPAERIIEIDFPSEDDEILNFKGIFSPVISSCLRIDNFTCSAKIFEENGINKELTVTYRFCNTFGVDIIPYNETVLVLNITTGLNDSVIVEKTRNETNDICVRWTVLDKDQIESELKIEATKLLNDIIDVERGRNQIKTKINLTQQVGINI